MNAAIPESMQAVTHRHYGMDGIVLAQLPVPKPKSRQVLVQVHAASLNSWDLDVLRGSPYLTRLDAGLFRPNRKVLGADVAGVVVSCGAEVQDFKVGDQVFGDLSNVGWSAFAEYVATDETALSKVPSGLSMEIAAAIPQAGVLALQALRDIRTVQPGDRVLINGAGGGVGCFAVQLAKKRGAYVVGVDAASKSASILRWGADEVLDYATSSFWQGRDKFDLIVDVVGKISARQYRNCLKPNGALALIGGTGATLLQVGAAMLNRKPSEGRKLALVIYRANRADQDELARQVAGRALDVAIDRVVSLNEAPHAFERLASGEVVGKLVFRVQS